MTESLPASAIQEIGNKLDKLHQLGAISYYLRSDPEGEQFVIGLKGQILKMDQDQVVCFLAGCTAVSEFVARQRGLPISFTSCAERTTTGATRTVPGTSGPTSA